jgi:hypothetical protein
MRLLDTMSTNVAALRSLTGATAGPSTSQAADACMPACRYGWVTKLVDRKVPYTEVLTLYDSCGRPYKVARTRYKTVQFTEQVRVAVRDLRLIAVARGRKLGRWPRPRPAPWLPTMNWPRGLAGGGRTVGHCAGPRTLSPTSTSGTPGRSSLSSPPESAATTSTTSARRSGGAPGATCRAGSGAGTSGPGSSRSHATP